PAAWTTWSWTTIPIRAPAAGSSSPSPRRRRWWPPPGAPSRSIATARRWRASAPARWSSTSRGTRRRAATASSTPRSWKLRNPDPHVTVDVEELAAGDDASARAKLHGRAHRDGKRDDRAGGEREHLLGGQRDPPELTHELDGKIAGEGFVHGGTSVVRADDAGHAVAEAAREAAARDGQDGLSVGEEDHVAGLERGDAPGGDARAPPYGRDGHPHAGEPARVAPGGGGGVDEIGRHEDRDRAARPAELAPHLARARVGGRRGAARPGGAGEGPAAGRGGGGGGTARPRAGDATGGGPASGGL